VAFDSVARTLVPAAHQTKGSDIFLHWDENPASGPSSP
jgi:hypothetical protein